MRLREEMVLGQRDLCVTFHSPMGLKPTTIVQRSGTMVFTGVTWTLTETPGETALWTLACGVS